MENYLFNTERLGFRSWKDNDLEELAALNKDSRVMKYFPSLRTEEETFSFINRMQDDFYNSGICFFAVEIIQNKEFIGFIGLNNNESCSPESPCVEIGWRLKHSAWNKGYATEGAKAALKYGFHEKKYESIYSWTAIINEPSEHVMKKIGMSKVGNFDHPLVEDGHVLSKHLLYKITKSELPN